MTVPSVTYRVEDKKGEVSNIRKPSDLPDDNSIKCYYEPIALISIVTPSQYLGSVIELCTNKRATSKRFNLSLKYGRNFLRNSVIRNYI